VIFFARVGRLSMPPLPQSLSAVYGGEWLHFLLPFLRMVAFCFALLAHGCILFRPFGAWLRFVLPVWRMVVFRCS
jgi:hypothetical protein